MEETTYFGKMKVHLQFINKEQYENLNSPKPSTSHCFPIKEDKVLFTVNPRGLDIIGGHIEIGESPEEALIREAMEEGCIIPKSYELIGAIEVDNRDSKEMALEKGYPLLGYQLIYIVSDFEELEFNATHECLARKYVNIEEVSHYHHNWLKSHQLALDEAKNQISKKVNSKTNR